MWRPDLRELQATPGENPRGLGPANPRHFVGRFAAAFPVLQRRHTGDVKDARTSGPRQLANRQASVRVRGVPVDPIHEATVAAIWLVKRGL